MFKDYLDSIWQAGFFGCREQEFFDFVDVDQSGTIGRQEIKRLMRS